VFLAYTNCKLFNVYCSPFVKLDLSWIYEQNQKYQEKIRFLLVFALSAFSSGQLFDRFGNALQAFDAEGKPIGLICKVEKVDVCVLAMTEEDCTKLGGEKADSCSMAEKATEPEIQRTKDKEPVAP